MLTYLFCSKKTKKKPILARMNTPYPKKQSVIDVDSGTIDQVEIKFENVEQEILPGTGVLHIFKKNE